MPQPNRKEIRIWWMCSPLHMTPTDVWTPTWRRDPCFRCYGGNVTVVDICLPHNHITNSDRHLVFFWPSWVLILGPPRSAAPPHVLLHPHSEPETFVRTRLVQLKDPDPAVSLSNSCLFPACHHVSLLLLWADGKKVPPSSICLSLVRFLFLST